MKKISFLEQPRRGNTHEVQLTPHKAKPQCGAHEVQLTPHKAKPQCGAHEVQLTPHKAKPQCGAHEVQLTPHKAAGRSVGAVAAILILAVFAAACDPGYTEDVVIRNASSHYVTIIPLHPENDASTATIGDGTYTLAPNEEVVIEQLGGIGSASFEEGVNYFKAFYGDSVKFGFGGFAEEILVREKTYYAWETEGISPYNFQSLNYTYEEKRNTGRVFHNLPYYGKLTFTITNEHYEEAER